MQPSLLRKVNIGAAECPDLLISPELLTTLVYCATLFLKAIYISLLIFILTNNVKTEGRKVLMTMMIFNTSRYLFSENV